MAKKPNGLWTKVSKKEVIKIMEWMIAHPHFVIGCPFTIMCFEYDYDWVNRSEITMDDLGTLKEDDENYYKNFELRF